MTFSQRAKLTVAIGLVAGAQHLTLAAEPQAETVTPTAQEQRAARRAQQEAAVEQKFLAADLDHDGVLSQHEFETGFPHLLQESADAFAVVDANHDQHITRDELRGNAYHLNLHREELEETDKLTRYR